MARREKKKKKGSVGAFSYQARIKDPEVIKVLNQLGPKYTSHTRHLFSQMSKNSDFSKKDLSKDWNLLARQFNSCKVEAETRKKNVLANYQFQVDNIPTRLAAIEEDLKDSQDPFVIHQKKRQWERQNDKLIELKAKISEKDATCVFGSKRLWLAQFRLKANGYTEDEQGHRAWYKDWQAARNFNFQMVGSHDETMGNGMCQLIRGQLRSWDLQLRLPTSYQEEYLIISNLQFNYDSETVFQAIQQAYLQNLHSETRNAIAYRFHKDHKGWIVTINIYLLPVDLKVSFQEGGIGTDINHDHLSYAEFDRHGNLLPRGLVGVGDIPLDLNGDADHDQNNIQEAAKHLVNLALRARKGLVIEELDFKKKTAQLAKIHGPAYATMLTSFAYSAITQAILSRAYRMGVEVRQVNPAFTSCIGLFKYRDRYGLSTHQAAAYVIGRRGFHLSERLPKPESAYTLRAGRFQVTLKKPVDSSKHVWGRWGNVLGQMQGQLRKLRRKLKLEQTSHLRIRSADSGSDLRVMEGSVGDGTTLRVKRRGRPSKIEPVPNPVGAVFPQVMRSSECIESEVVVPF